MHRTLATLIVGIISPSLVFGQGGGPRIEKEDIFDRLAPLVRARDNNTPRAAANTQSQANTSDAIITDAAARDEKVLVETPAQPIGSAVNQAQPPVATELSPRVRRLLNPNRTSGPSDGEPQIVDEAHIVQTQGELARLSPNELRQLIVVCAELLSNELSDVHYGDRWRKFLHLPEVSAALSDDPSTASAGLQLILDSYGKIARDKQYHAITDRYAFHLLHHGLAEYLSTEQERDQRRGAYDDIGKLLKALQPVPTGHQWREYFALDRAARLLTSPGPLSRDEVGQLQLILARFEQAAIEPRFKAVAKLPGFAATHRRLQIAVAVIPDAEADTFTQTELPGQPVPNDQPASVHLIAQDGLAFYRPKDADSWRLADGPVELKSGDSVRTGDKGIARLAIGAEYEVVCLADTLLHVSQYIDDNGRLVTQLHTAQGNFKISGGTKQDAAVASTGQRIVIARGEHKIAVGDGPLELDFQHDARGKRTISAVYEGTVQVRHQQTGDQVTLRAGREAVMLQAGIAVRAAAEQPDAWWPSRRVQTAAEPGNGFTR